jgi:hypothetical protein
MIAFSGPVAQWIEQAFPKRCVGGSSPLRPISTRLCSVVLISKSSTDAATEEEPC